MTRSEPWRAPTTRPSSRATGLGDRPAGRHASTANRVRTSGRCMSRAPSTATPAPGAVAVPAAGLVLRTGQPRRSHPRCPGPIRPAVSRTAHPPASNCWSTRWTRPWYPWARLAPERWPSCAATSTSTRTPADTTRGTRAHRPPSPSPPACTCQGRRVSAALQPARPVPALPAHLPRELRPVGLASGLASCAILRRLRRRWRGGR